MEKNIDKENTIKLVKIVNKRYNRLIEKNKDLKMRMYFLYFLLCVSTLCGFILIYIYN